MDDKDDGDLSTNFMSFAGLLRTVRRHADLSQRELAQQSGVCTSVIARLETGRTLPHARTIERLLMAVGYRLQAVGPDGTVIDPARTWRDTAEPRDGAFRRFPAHLDVRHPTVTRPWWYDLHTTWGVKNPLLTFDLTRSRRERWRQMDERGPTHDDERLKYQGQQSRVVIPGYRPKPRYG